MVEQPQLDLITICSLQQFEIYKELPLTGLELRTSGIESTCSSNSSLAHLWQVVVTSSM